MSQTDSQNFRQMVLKIPKTLTLKGDLAFFFLSLFNKVWVPKILSMYIKHASVLCFHLIQTSLSLCSYSAEYYCFHREGIQYLFMNVLSTTVHPFLLVIYWDWLCYNTIYFPTGFFCLWKMSLKGFQASVSHMAMQISNFSPLGWQWLHFCCFQFYKAKNPLELTLTNIKRIRVPYPWSNLVLIFPLYSLSGLGSIDGTIKFLCTSTFPFHFLSLFHFYISPRQPAFDRISSFFFVEKYSPFFLLVFVSFFFFCSFAAYWVLVHPIAY